MVFIETSLFTKLLGDYLSDDEYAALQAHLVAYPDGGAIIRGSGGVRKIRWRSGGKGKSGGVRVIYYWATFRSPDFHAHRVREGGEGGSHFGRVEKDRPIACGDDQ